MDFIYTNKHMHTHIYICIYIYIHTYIHMYTYMHREAYIDIHIYIYIFMCTYKYTYVYVHMYMYICIYAHMYVNFYIYYSWYILHSNVHLYLWTLDTFLTAMCTHLTIPLNFEHELTRQRKWDKQETQENMRHFNALKLDKLTSDPR